MKKKLTAIAIAFMALVAVPLTSCGGKDKEKEDEKKEVALTPENVDKIVDEYIPRLKAAGTDEEKSKIIEELGKKLEKVLSNCHTYEDSVKVVDALMSASSVIYQ